MDGLDIVWGIDVQAQETIEQLSLDCSQGSIFMSEIDWVTSKINKARDVFLDFEHKDSIRKSMESRCTIPMIVVRKTSKGYVIAGGNHRANAAKDLLAGTESIPVYIVECTDIEFEHLACLLNGKNGKPLSREERISRAIDFHKRFGVTQADAANMFSVNAKTLNTAVRAFDRARIMNIELKPGVGTALSRIPEEQFKLTAVRDAYAKMFRSVKNISINDLVDVAEKASLKGSESEMIAVIEASYKRPSKIVSDLNKPRTQAIRALKKLATTLEKAVALKASFATLDDASRKEVVEIWESIKKNIAKCQ